LWWGKPTGKLSRGRPRRMWKDNVKMRHREVGREYGRLMEWLKIV
jgi:hypothetical protein